MLGFIEFYWVLLGFTGFYWVLLGFRLVTLVRLVYLPWIWISSDFFVTPRLFCGLDRVGGVLILFFFAFFANRLIGRCRLMVGGPTGFSHIIRPSLSPVLSFFLSSFLSFLFPSLLSVNGGPLRCASRARFHLEFLITHTHTHTHAHVNVHTRVR